MNSTQADRDILKNIDGLYYHLLTEDEIESLNRCIKDNLATRSYEGVGGIIGFSKARMK
jgi:hypothetical protein